MRHLENCFYLAGGINCRLFICPNNTRRNTKKSCFCAEKQKFVDREKPTSYNINERVSTS